MVCSSSDTTCVCASPPRASTRPGQCFHDIAQFIVRLFLLHRRHQSWEYLPVPDLPLTIQIKRAHRRESSVRRYRPQQRRTVARLAVLPGIPGTYDYWPKKTRPAELASKNIILYAFVASSVDAELQGICVVCKKRPRLQLQLKQQGIAPTQQIQFLQGQAPLFR